MTFKQILIKYNSIISKNQLNEILALTERYFGVFSRDMELDIRSLKCTAEPTLLCSTSDVGYVGHEVTTANEAEDCYTVVLVQDTQRAQHLA